MYGDILLIQKKHIKAAENIVKKISGNILDNKINKFIIAISGESGSGKSEIAHLISKFLKNKGILTKILHADNYYIIPPKDRNEWRKKNGLKSIDFKEYNWGLIKKNIKEFKESKVSVLPFMDLLTDQIDKLRTDFKGIDVLILEGLYSLYIDYDIDLRIFIDRAYHDTKRAQVSRGKEKYDEFRLKVLEREHEVVQSLKSKADLIITKDYKIVTARNI